MSLVVFEIMPIAPTIRADWSAEQRMKEGISELNSSVAGAHRAIATRLMCELLDEHGRTPPLPFLSLSSRHTRKRS